MKRFVPISGEVVVLSSPKHWKNYIVPMLLMLVCLAALLLRLHFWGTTLVDVLRQSMKVPDQFVGLLCIGEVVILGLLMMSLLVKIVNVAYTRYYVTNRRVICSSGWMVVTLSDMMLDKCEYVGLNQRVWERLFNSGDIICISAGARVYMDDVYHARRFRQTVMELLGNRMELSYPVQRELDELI